jgi:hypothetical protein
MPTGDLTMAKVTEIPAQMTKINWSTAGSVVVGLSVFGGLLYLIGKLPSNAVTTPIKTAASAVR